MLLLIWSPWLYRVLLPEVLGKREKGRVDGIAPAPLPAQFPKKEDIVAACDSHPAAQEGETHLPVDGRGKASATHPPDAETGWWLRIEVVEFEFRALLDPGASTTVMGTVGLQLATALGRTFVAAEKQGVRLADGSRSPLVGHVILPITVTYEWPSCPS